MWNSTAFVSHYAKLFIIACLQTCCCLRKCAAVYWIFCRSSHVHKMRAVLYCWAAYLYLNCIPIIVVHFYAIFVSYLCDSWWLKCIRVLLHNREDVLLPRKATRVTDLVLDKSFIGMFFFISAKLVTYNVYVKFRNFFWNIAFHV